MVPASYRDISLGQIPRFTTAAGTLVRKVITRRLRYWKHGPLQMA